MCEIALIVSEIVDLSLHRSAHRGKRALVLTIDPARRLANALGMREFGNDERVVDAAAFAKVGLGADKIDALFR